MRGLPVLAASDHYIAVQYDDPALTAQRPLRFFAYGIGVLEGADMPDSHSKVLDWFERLLEEDDVDVMAWALGTRPIPAAFAGPEMDAMRRLDYVDIPR